MRTLGEMSCSGLEWTIFRGGHMFSCSVYVEIESLVTWMMELGIISLDDHDLGK
jgi:hypothetical protein